MSKILEAIKADLKLNMMIEVTLRKKDLIPCEEFNNAVAYKTVARAIISMFPSIGKKPGEATDEDVIKLLKKYIHQEKERLLYTNKHIIESDVNGISYKDLKKMVDEKIQELGDNLTSTKVKIAQGYLPKQASEEDIVSWIKDNVDFSKYKNKMQAMGPIMKQFKGCDGNFVKNILMNYQEK